MGSLQDQLLKAGLATPEQLRKARGEQRREQRREPRGRREAQDGSRTPGTRPAARSRPDRPATLSPAAPGRDSEPRKGDARPPGRGREGRRRRGAARAPLGQPGQPPGQGPRQRPAGESPPAPDPSVQALNLRIRSLLDRYALNDRNAEVAFHFTRDNVVRRVYVTDEQRRKLAGGELAVVGFRRRHHLVPAAVADEIQILRPIVFVHRAAGAGEDQAAPPGALPDAEDPYRDFPVPDDLRW